MGGARSWCQSMGSRVRACPVCDTPASQATPFLERNIDDTRLSGYSFASRKMPEFMCHRLVRCRSCELIFADDPPDQSMLAEAYHAAEFDSVVEAEDAAEAYDRALAPILARLPRQEAALEIGTGTGSFLERLAHQGFSELIGVEPSLAAIAAAPAHRRGWIREGIFRGGDFEAGRFDLVVCFMTMEHVRDPREIVTAALRLLRPGGALALVTHDYRGIVNRLLGRRSPIIDIEHMQLFSPISIRRLLESSGFRSVEVSAFANRYALRYWVRLLPLPVSIKAAMIRLLGSLGLAEHKVTLPVGNMLSVGFRPAF